MKTRLFRLTLLVITLAFNGAADVTPNGMVVLLTDYGNDSIYVGILKGAIYSKFPQAKVDSVTNSVPSFDIVTGAFMLVEACGIFPRGTTFCCVVDPGVGTERKCIAIETKAGQFFVGPDNGLLWLAAEKYGLAAAYECTNKAFWRKDTASKTFQGRDIFGPVAACLASGQPLDKVGTKLETIARLNLPASRIEGRTAQGVVIRVDTYGNIVTNITGEQLGRLGIEKGAKVKVAIGKAEFTAPFVSTYADVPLGERLVVLQSSGFVECAINRGNLAEAIGEKEQAPVSLKGKDEDR